jgi:hypothetical protein
MGIFGDWLLSISLRSAFWVDISLCEGKNAFDDNEEKPALGSG